MVSKELRVLTLNCWGLAIVSKHRQARMQAIAQELAKGRYDIVSLQEVWLAKDYQLLQKTTKDVLPYSHYFHGGLVGGGVCIFSKGPIVDTFYHPFRLNGYCHKVFHGDWMAGKMAGMCVIRHKGLTINVYTTHLHALYAPSLNPAADEFLPHRLVQAYELSEFVHHTSSGCDLALVMGDLNTEPETLACKVIKSHGLTDAWEVRENKEDNQPYTTCETPSNVYTFIKTQYYHDNSPEGGRIDYVLFRSNPKTTQVACKNAQLAMQKIPDVSGMNYSDHEGVETTFDIEEVTDSTSSLSTDDQDAKRLQALTDLLPHIQTAKDAALSHRIWYLVRAVFIIVFIIFLYCVSPSDMGYLSMLLQVGYTVLVLVVALFVCSGLVVKGTEKNVLVGVEQDVKLRIELLQHHDQGC